ncbi:hypothetical protein Btru_039784 [Bulinus truncatus]|nr:hypothetical protein Btru_039784 [Bulinus truncatus]
MTTPEGLPSDVDFFPQSIAEKCCHITPVVQESAGQHTAKLLISGSNKPVPLKAEGVTQLVRGCQNLLFPKPLKKNEFPSNVHREKEQTESIRHLSYPAQEDVAFELDEKDDFYLELAEKYQTPYNARGKLYVRNSEVKHHTLENSNANEIENKNASNNEKVISELQTYCKTTDYPKSKMDYSHLPFSKTDSLSSLGKRLKLRIYNWQNAPQHTFHQTLHVYPVFNQNVKPTFHNLMRYEIFRIGTFAYFNISTETNFWVTRLAESGFYSVDGSGRICCFSCGSMCDVADEQTLERAHRHDCRRQEQNIPLNEWTVGLNRGDSHPYFSLFGQLTPTLFDESEPTLDNLTTALDTLNIESAAGDTDQNATRDIAFAEMPDGNDHRQPQSSDLEGVHDPGRPGISPNNNSLPTNLNEVSSGLVIQESDGSASREVLTSASIEPMSMSHTPVQTVNVTETPGPEQNNTVIEEGAVGGQTSYDLGRASYPQFASSAARRSTFVGWNPDHPQRPDDLVAGGFFYAGYADCVRCFYCGLGLKYWRPTDLPTYQHARFRPNCVYNRMYKGQEYIDKVQQDLREEQAQAVPNETNADNQVATEYAPEPSVPDVTQPPPSPPDQGHEYMNLPASQEALRIGWRSEQIVQAVTNVVEEMGIVPENVQFDMLLDVLRELYSADDAPRTNLHNIPSRREETISSSSVAEPSMASIRQPPPSTPLDPDGDELKNTKTTGSDSPAVAAAIETADGAATVEVSNVPAGSQEQYHALSRENAFLNQRTICTICQRQPVSCIYLPCGHVIACQGCARNESICRSCHRKIAATSNIYLS